MSDETFIVDPFNSLGDIVVTASSFVDTTARRWWQPWAIRPGREGVGFRGVSLDDPNDIIYIYFVPNELGMAVYLGRHGNPEGDELINVIGVNTDE